MSFSLTLDLQLADALITTDAIPCEADFSQWATAALHGASHQLSLPLALELSLRVVDETEGRELNHDYRERDYATNVLSFPSDLPGFLRDELPALPLGDLVMCAPVVTREAVDQGKAPRDHWAHLTVHGVLHLLGFDHVDEADANIMEALEIKVLADLGIANPYDDHNDHDAT